LWLDIGHYTFCSFFDDLLLGFLYMLDDTEDALSACAELITSEHTETFPLTLLTHCSPGEWVPVTVLCKKLGVNTGVCSDRVFSTWLPDPLMSSDYAVILFYDAQNVTTFSALYNRARLLGAAPTKKNSDNSSHVRKESGDIGST
jgi:hypothetical protein